jgi:hypothetical protein
MAPQHVCWHRGSRLRCCVPRNHQVGVPTLINKAAKSNRTNSVFSLIRKRMVAMIMLAHLLGLFDGLFNGGAPSLNPALVFLISQIHAKI